MFFSVLASIYLMFFVQFKVENLQDKIIAIDEDIASYEDEIKVLQVEWVYLTRPERLRILAKKYLHNNDYIASNQVKNFAELEKYYLTNLAKSSNQQVALGN